MQRNSRSGFHLWLILLLFFNLILKPLWNSAVHLHGTGNFWATQVLMHWHRERPAKDCSPGRPWTDTAQNAGYPLPLSDYRRGCIFIFLSIRGSPVFLQVREDSSHFLPGWLRWLESPGKAIPGLACLAHCHIAFLWDTGELAGTGILHSYSCFPWHWHMIFRQEVTFS